MLCEQLLSSYCNVFRDYPLVRHCILKFDPDSRKKTQYISIYLDAFLPYNLSQNVL